MNNTQTSTEAPELERLVDLAAELGVPLEQLAKNLGGDVTHDAVGYRAVSVELATVLLDDKRRSEAEAIEQARRRHAENLRQRDAQRLARSVREARRNVDRVAQIDALVATGLSVAAAMVTLDGPPAYEGDHRHIPPPPPPMSSNPFLIPSGGEFFSPPRSPRRKRGAS